MQGAAGADQAEAGSVKFCQGMSKNRGIYQMRGEARKLAELPTGGSDMGLDVAANRVKGRTETAENSQDPRTYQTEKKQENIKAQCKHDASTVFASEKYRSCPADSLIPDSKNTSVVADQLGRPTTHDRAD